MNPPLTSLADMQSLLGGSTENGSVRDRLMQELMRRTQSAPASHAPNSVPNKKIARLRRRLHMLEVRNQAFAAACGACPHCWGAKACRHCDMHGGPGRFQPDPDAFERFIEPVLRRIGLVVDGADEHGDENTSADSVGVLKGT